MRRLAKSLRSTSPLNLTCDVPADSLRPDVPTLGNGKLTCSAWSSLRGSFLSFGLFSRFNSLNKGCAILLKLRCRSLSSLCHTFVLLYSVILIGPPDLVNQYLWEHYAEYWSEHYEDLYSRICPEDYDILFKDGTRITCPEKTARLLKGRDYENP